MKKRSIGGIALSISPMAMKIILDVISGAASLDQIFKSSGFHISVGFSIIASVCMWAFVIRQSAPSLNSEDKPKGGTEFSRWRKMEKNTIAAYKNSNYVLGAVVVSSIILNAYLIYKYVDLVRVNTEVRASGEEKRVFIPSLPTGADVRYLWNDFQSLISTPEIRTQNPNILTSITEEPGNQLNLVMEVVDNQETNWSGVTILTNGIIPSENSDEFVIVHYRTRVSDQGNVTLQDTWPFVDNRWHTYVVIYGQGEIQGYVDGIVVDDDPTIRSLESLQIAWNSRPGERLGFTIGVPPKTTSWIDDVYVWSTTRPPFPV